MRACVSQKLFPFESKPSEADEVWVGVNDSDIIAACRLVLSSTGPILTGLLLFQSCVGSQGSHVLEIIHPRAPADMGPKKL